MTKWLLFILALSVLSTGCGKKSTIKNSVKAEKLSCAYGDCNYIIKNVTFPLDDSSLAFETPLPGLGPIAGGIIKFVGDIFAKNTDMGKVQVSYTQPIPAIPEELHSVRLKRFFFYMKPSQKKKQNLRGTVTDWFNRYILGKGHTTFAFLDKLAIRLSTTSVEDPDHYTPVLVNKIDSKEAEKELLDAFKGTGLPKVIDPEVATDLILLKYHRKYKNNDTNYKDYGKIHYLETTGSAAEVKRFLLKQEIFKGHHVRILILEKSLIIELAKDHLADEIFRNMMMEKADEMDELGVNYIDTCTQSSCLEVNVPHVNIVPIARKGNSLKLDALIHAADVPESFKLKGFVEFEAKIKSDI